MADTGGVLDLPPNTKQGQIMTSDNQTCNIMVVSLVLSINQKFKVQLAVT